MEKVGLFSSIKVGNKTVSNRFVYQPTESNNCDISGAPTEETLTFYINKAGGQPGILFIESIDVSMDCQARSNRMVITKENKESYRLMIEKIRKVSPGTLILFQLSHAGRLSDSHFKDPLYVYKRNSSENTMTAEEIRKASDDFVNAALIIDEIGGDGVDIKQAHGFLAGDFLHPANNRTDEYGGIYENRIRFFRNIFNMVKSHCSKDFIIGTRISPYEGIPGGCGTNSAEGVIEDLSEMELMVRDLDKLGVDFINVSAGYAAANLEILLPTATFPEGVYRHFTWTSLIKKQVSVPVIGSGYSYLRDGENALTGEESHNKSLLYFAEQNVANGVVDLIGLGRQSIADPLFVKKVREHKQEDINWCTCCSGCGILLGNNKIIGCTKHDDRFKEIFKNIQ